jgi:predicted transcriptional regulator
MLEPTRLVFIEETCTSTAMGSGCEAAVREATAFSATQAPSSTKGAVIERTDACRICEAMACSNAQHAGIVIMDNLPMPKISGLRLAIEAASA